MSIKTKVLLSFLLFAQMLFAQDWNLVHLNRQNHYLYLDNYYFTHSVKSLETFGDDTLFRFNQKFDLCDTCFSQPNDQFTMMPRIFMRRCLKQDSVYRFKDTADFAIMPYAPLGAVWIFDTVNNIQANISEVYQGTIFNEVDSFKRISLSIDADIIISKKYGIVEYDREYFYNPVELGGVFGTIQKGFHLYTNDDFFNYEVGDVFQYIDEKYLLGLPFEPSDYLNFYYQVKEITHTDSSVQLLVDQCLDVLPEYHQTEYQFIENQNLTFTKYPFTDSVALDFFGLSKQFLLDEFPEVEFPQFYDSLAVVIGANLEGTEKQALFKILDSTGSAVLPHGSFNMFFRHYDKNFERRINSGGRTKTNIFKGNWPSFNCGMLSIDEIKVDERFSLYPNPAQNEINVSRMSVTQPYEIQLYDVNGKLLLRKNWSAGESIESLNIESFEKGVYVIHFKQGNKLIGEERFVKAN